VDVYIGRRRKRFAKTVYTSRTTNEKNETKPCEIYTVRPVSLEYNRSNKTDTGTERIMKIWEVITITLIIIRTKFHVYRWTISRSLIASSVNVYVCDRGYDLNMEKNLDQRNAIKFCFKLGKSATETFQMFNEAYAESVMSCATVFRWQGQFSNSIIKTVSMVFFF